ncbi:MAG: MFS transporter [Actinomycetota bacterium]
MTATSADPATGRRGILDSLLHRQLHHYPDTRPRIAYLAITVLATVMLYYELYVGGSVSTLLLTNLKMTFTFYVVVLAFGNLIGAFGSLLAGLTDRLGRANLVVFGLLFTAIFTAFVLPAATDKWVFSIEGFVVGIVEGICLVATPALIRDFSPQVGRATAMGFWTSGPVLGSLIVAVVGSATIPAVVTDTRFWTHEYLICGIAGIVVFLIALFGLRELSPQLRDQLMVTMRDRALIEAKAKGIDITAALRHPFRQLLKPDVVISALAVSLMLLVYYTAVGFAVIYFTTVFGFSVKDANGLGNWNWGFNVLAVILIGIVSDRFRVRKPFMVVGGGLAAVMVVVFLLQFGHHPSYYKLALILALLSFGLGVAYTPWMASFTETVEARNPALTATGLAIWGWIIRVVVFVSFLVIPAMVNSVTPLITYGSTVSAYATQYKSELAFAQTHAPLIAFAQSHKDLIAFAQSHQSLITFASTHQAEIANAQKFGPELAVIQKNPALFTKLAATKNPSPALLGQAVAAAGGGAKGQQILKTITTNGPAINAIIADGPQLQQVSANAAQLQAVGANAAQLQQLGANATQLAALQKVPPSVFAYLSAHAASVQKAATQTAGQWKSWLWVCFGGIIFFLLSIPLLKGRWKTSDARKDEAEHEALVEAELAKIGS